MFWNDLQILFLLVPCSWNSVLLNFHLKTTGKPKEMATHSLSCLTLESVGGRPVPQVSGTWCRVLWMVHCPAILEIITAYEEMGGGDCRWNIRRQLPITNSNWQQRQLTTTKGVVEEEKRVPSLMKFKPFQDIKKLTIHWSRTTYVAQLPDRPNIYLDNKHQSTYSFQNDL